MSAGILLQRDSGEVLLVHPGGPFFAKKDLGAWSIPKGEIEGGENPAERALIEFAEETGTTLEPDALRPLGEIKQKGGKRVIVFAARGDLDADAIVSNTFELHGRTYPEVDRAAWFDLDEARRRINPAQAALLDQL